MDYKREVERKCLVIDMTYEEAERSLAELHTMTATSTSVDRFWTAKGVDFIRLRENSRELTVKVTDRGTITDRIEENVVVEDTDRTYAYLSLVHGDPCLTLTKEFSVFQTQDAVICLYRVLEDPAGRVFFEAEADTMDKVNLALVKLPFRTALLNRSLFQIFYEMGFERLNRGCEKVLGPCTCGAWHTSEEEFR